MHHVLSACFLVSCCLIIEPQRLAIHTSARVNNIKVTFFLTKFASSLEKCHYSSIHSNIYNGEASAFLSVSSNWHQTHSLVCSRQFKSHRINWDRKL